MTFSDEITKMAEVDQAMRQHAQTSGAWDPLVDREHTRRLKEIIREIGWPTKSKVGPRASHLAWLLAQHADQDVAFQRECLRLMQAAPAEEIEQHDLAYLEDRVRVNEGRLQRYGTQFYTNDTGQLQPRPIEDPDHLDERRRAAGMEGFAAYQRRLLEVTAKSAG